MESKKSLKFITASVLTIPMVLFGAIPAANAEELLADNTEIERVDETVEVELPVNGETTENEMVEPPIETIDENIFTKPETPEFEDAELEVDNGDHSSLLAPVENLKLFYNMDNDLLVLNFSDYQSYDATIINPEYITELYNANTHELLDLKRIPAASNTEAEQHFNRTENVNDYYVIVSKIADNQPSSISFQSPTITIDLVVDNYTVNLTIDNDRYLVVDWSNYVRSGATLDRYNITVIGGGYSYGQVIYADEADVKKLATVKLDGNTLYKVGFAFIDDEGQIYREDYDYTSPIFKSSPVTNAAFDPSRNSIVWEAPLDLGGDPGGNYHVSTSHNGTMTEYVLEFPGRIYLRDFKNIPGERVDISIRFINEGGASDPVEFSYIQPYTAPESPKGLKLSADETTLTAKWLKPDDDQVNIVKSYNYTLFTSDGNTYSAGIIDLTSNDESPFLETSFEVAPGKSYYMALRAVNPSWQSDAIVSNTIEVKPNTSPVFMDEDSASDYIKGESSFEISYQKELKTITVTGVDVAGDWLYGVMGDGLELGWDDRDDYNDRGVPEEDDIFVYDLEDELNAGEHTVLLYDVNGIIGFGAFTVASENDDDDGSITPPVNVSPIPNKPVINDDTINNVAPTLSEHNESKGKIATINSQDELARTGESQWGVGVIGALALMTLGLAILTRRKSKMKVKF